jgi:hypothetical protein
VVLADCWAPSSLPEGRPSFVLMKFPLIWIHPSLCEPLRHLPSLFA